MPLVSGSRFGVYEIVSPLGAGGMGEVWRARDPRLEREVALKVLPAHALTDETWRSRLLREARLASRLNHPHICTIHEVGEAEGQVYIAMELVEGQSLAELLAAGPLSLEQVLRYGQQLADALATAHERGIVHRDLKSGNVVITPEGRAKVLDFGLAKRIAAGEIEAATTVAEDSLTAPGAVVGTLAYMAPEQLRGMPADARSDVWALGVMLYEMATGARPFRGQTGFEVTSAILREAPAPLPRPIPPQVAAVIGRCLAKEPGERYQRASEVRAALETVQSGGILALPPSRARGSPGRRWLPAAAALLAALAVLAALGWRDLRGRLSGRGGTSARAIKLAVLPFANLTGDPEQEYLSDGVTQEMIAQLGRLHPESLSVIARTSVMRYKKGDTPIDQIGRELGVDYVLEGSARREASRIRISAELIQVRDQSQLWAEVYERQMAGILALQSEVAQKVAAALALRLLPAEQARLVNVRSVDPEAYDAYLKGLHHWSNLTVEDLDASQRYFELALQKDPSYAAAWAGMALMWATRSQIGATPPSEAAPKAKAAALKAVALDDTVAEAHFALAAVESWQEWDWASAGPEWQRAIELNPSFPDARAFYSHYLMILRRPDEAMTQIERALELDPLNSLFQAIYAIDLVFAHRFDEARAEAQKSLRTQPDNLVAQSVLWNSSRLAGKTREALAAARAFYGFYNDPALTAAFAGGATEADYRVAMRRAAEALEALSRRTYVTPLDVAWAYLDAGDRAKTLQWLEKGLEAHDPNLPYLGSPEWDALRAEPRFRALLRSMNLPQG